MTSYETNEFYNYARIIDPESAPAREFSEQMDALARQLLGNRYDPERHAFRFLLADQPSMNAFTIPRSTPPVIVIYRGLIENLHSMDELAGVLAHEIGHNIAHQEFAGKAGNSKAEEMAADLWAVKLMSEAGYNPRAMESLLGRLDEKKQTTLGQRIERALLDVHPLSDNRVSAIENARIILAREGYNIPDGQTAIPARLIQNATAQLFQSTTDVKASAQRRGFDAMLPEQQMELLINAALGTEARSHDRTRSMAVELYRNQILDLWGSLKIPHDKPETVEAFHRAFDRMFETGLWKGDVHRFYQASANVLHGSANPLYPIEASYFPAAEGGQKYPPIGRLRYVRDAAQAFVRATTLESAVEAAQNFEVAHKAAQSIFSNQARSGGVDRLRYNIEFDVPPMLSANEIAARLVDGEVMEPYLRLHEWARSSHHIANSMMYLFGGGYGGYSTGIPRSDHSMPANEYGILGSEAVSLEEIDRTFEYKNGIVTGNKRAPVTYPPYRDFEWSARHGIEIKEIQYTAEKGKAGKALEVDYFEQRHQWERQLLAEGVPWQQLVDDQKEFFRVYAEAFRPQISYETRQHPFAEATISAMQDLARKHPHVMTRDYQHNLLSTQLSQYHAEFVTYDEDGQRAVDPTHPYVTYLLELGRNIRPANRTREHSPFLMYQRVEPFDGLDRLPMRREEMSAEQLRAKRTPVSHAHLVESVQYYLRDPQIDFERLLHLIDDFDRINWDPNDIRNAVKFTQLKQAVGTRIHEVYEQLPPVETSEFIFQHARMLSLDSIDNFPEIERGMAQRLVERIAAESNPELRRDLLRLVLDRPYLTQRFPLDQLPDDVVKPVDNSFSPNSYRLGKFSPPTPELRQQFADVIIADVTHGLGIDNGSPTFAEALQSRLALYKEKTEGALLTRVLSGVADQVEAQPKLAAQLKDDWQKIGGAKVTHREITARISEAGMEKIKDSPVDRANFIEFLSNPAAERAAPAYLDKLSSQSSFFGGVLNRETQIQVLRDAHAEFWNSPLPARAAFLNEYVFPKDADYHTTMQVTQRVLERLIGDPQNQQPLSQFDIEPFEARAQALRVQVADPKQSEKHDSSGLTPAERLQQLEADYQEYLTQTAKPKEPFRLRRPAPTTEQTANLTVESYLQAVADQDPAESRLLLSALMAADHERTPGQPMRVGQTLNLVLSQMGPAGAKLLQAIHSHPDTPEDIRNDLKYSKINHEPPARWTVTEIAENAGLLDPDAVRPITRLGPTIGVGSMGITLLNDTANGQVADTLLKPNAHAQASREFTFMLRAAQLLSARDPRMAPVLSMIQEAQNSVEIETRMSLAAKQDTVAQQVYEGVTVTIPQENGAAITITNRAMPLVEHGDQFKRAALASGAHFLDLPVSDPNRVAIAEAMITTQLSARFAGLPMDRDRHGGNIKVEGNTISHFDFGMMEALTPTDAQKQALGKVVAQAVMDTHKNGGDFSSHLVRRIDNLTASAETRQFLAGFKREILSLGDYMNVMAEGNPEIVSKRLTGILGTALFGESADQTIQQAFRKQMGLFAPQAEASLRQASADVGISITGIRQAESLQLPTLSQEEYALMRANTVDSLASGNGRGGNLHVSAGSGVGLAMGVGFSLLRHAPGGSMETARLVGGNQLATEIDASYADIAGLTPDAAFLTTAALAKVAPKIAPQAAPVLQRLVTNGAKAVGPLSLLAGAGVTYAEIRAAEAAQDGRRQAGALFGFMGGVAGGAGVGAAGGSWGGPWGALAGGTVGAIGGGFLASEYGRRSSMGDQMQRNLDRRAQLVVDTSIARIQQMLRTVADGHEPSDRDKSDLREIVGILIEQQARIRVLPLAETDVDGVLRRDFQLRQINQTLRFFDPDISETQRANLTPYTSGQMNARIEAQLPKLLAEINANPQWRNMLETEAFIPSDAVGSLDSRIPVTPQAQLRRRFDHDGPPTVSDLKQLIHATPGLALYILDRNGDGLTANELMGVLQNTGAIGRTLDERQTLGQMVSDGINGLIAPEITDVSPERRREYYAALRRLVPDPMTPGEKRDVELRTGFEVLVPFVEAERALGMQNRPATQEEVQLQELMAAAYFENYHGGDMASGLMVARRAINRDKPLYPTIEALDRAGIGALLTGDDALRNPEQGVYRANAEDFQHNLRVINNLLVADGINTTLKEAALDRDGDGILSVEEYMAGLTPEHQNAMRTYAPIRQQELEAAEQAQREKAIEEARIAAERSRAAELYLENNADISVTGTRSKKDRERLARNLVDTIHAQLSPELIAAVDKDAQGQPKHGTVEYGELMSFARDAGITLDLDDRDVRQHGLSPEILAQLNEHRVRLAADIGVTATQQLNEQQLVHAIDGNLDSSITISELGKFMRDNNITHANGESISFTQLEAELASNNGQLPTVILEQIRLTVANRNSETVDRA